MDRRPLSLLHTSDVHLGEPGGREERAFSAAIDLAIEADVDAVLIAGDLFDHARVPEVVLERAAAELERVGRPVVLLNGNHDLLHDSSVHLRFDVSRRCEHVRFLDDPAGSVVVLDELDLVVWGRAMVEHEPAFRPLLGVPERDPRRWSIVAAHGLAATPDMLAGRSSPIPTEDLQLDWDYVALGHVHAHRVVQTDPVTACYPGATAASKGAAAGVVLVDLTSAGAVDIEWVGLPLTNLRSPTQRSGRDG